MKQWLAVLVLGILVFAQSTAFAQIVRETNTPIALHYESILKDFIAFIKPKLNSNDDLTRASREYFQKLGYRLITVTLESNANPKVSTAWKIPHSKLAVLPRMVLYVSPDGPMVQLHDQGDDYILMHNHMDRTPKDQELFVTVGITHQWE